MTNEVINCIATHEYGYIASSVSVSLYCYISSVTGREGEPVCVAREGRGGEVWMGL